MKLSHRARPQHRKVHVPKSDQLNIRWRPDGKAAWERIARELRKEKTESARLVLQEFMSCYLSGEQLQGLGLGELREACPVIVQGLRQRGIRVGVSQSDATKLLEIEQSLGRKLTAKEPERFLGGNVEA